MAKVFPPLDQVDQLRVKPTPGEKHLLSWFQRELDDSYEVYFQPYLNGDNPDIIMLRPDSGVMIIEVKDWDLDCYQLSPNKHWQLRNVAGLDGRPQLVKSPIQQVFEYKENLYNLHIESLLEKRIRDYRYLSVVTCAIYFHQESKSRLDAFLRNGFEQDQTYLRFLSHFETLGHDSLNTDFISEMLHRRWLDRRSYLFDERLCKSFRRYLQPPVHTLEQGISIRYTDEQEKIIHSKAGVQQKIKGVAGSGKTLTLAKRAVNAHLRHGRPVLILTFNISLRNYIHDKISEVRENFEWKNFIILHYHQFIRAHNNNVEFVQTEPGEQTRPGGIFFETIIIDEIQDYQQDWVKDVRRFLPDHGELVVFGDEKQNIYNRELEDQKPYTGIRGAWNILRKSFRVTVDIGNLAIAFQKYFFTDKYEFDEIIFQRDLFDRSLIRYHYLQDTDTSQILDIYQQTLSETGVHDNDVCIQACKVDVLRAADQIIRKKLHKRTNTMFETQEVFEKLKAELTDAQNHTDEKKLKKELEVIRRYKKFNFWMNSGTTKLSTLHSFKGWEVPTLFLLIETEADSESEFTSDELIYTAITRCRQNLVIINLNNVKYHTFFRQIQF